MQLDLRLCGVANQVCVVYEPLGSLQGAIYSHDCGLLFFRSKANAQRLDTPTPQKASVHFFFFF